jgi:hypothetical protein
MLYVMDSETSAGDNVAANLLLVAGISVKWSLAGNRFDDCSI